MTSVQSGHVAEDVKCSFQGVTLAPLAGSTPSNGDASLTIDAVPSRGGFPWDPLAMNQRSCAYLDTLKHMQCEPIDPAPVRPHLRAGSD